jgi:hypothetical protein
MSTDRRWAAKYQELLTGYIDAMGGTSITAPRRALAEQIAVLQTELSLMTDRFASSGRGAAIEDLAAYLKLGDRVSDLMQTAGLGPSLQQPIVDQDRVAGAREELAALLTRRFDAQEAERQRGTFRDNNRKIITDPGRLQIAQEIHRLQQQADAFDNGTVIDNTPTPAAAPLVISKAAPPPAPPLTVVAGTAAAPPAPAPAEAKPPPPTDAELEEHRHRLASRRDALERERRRLAEDALTDPALRAPLNKLAAEQAALDTELQQVNSALAARLTEQSDGTTAAFLQWQGSSGGIRFSDWSPSSNPNWPRLR